MAYPYLSDVVRAATGLDLPLPLPMFGLFVALGLLIAAQCLRVELERMQRAGRIVASLPELHAVVSNLTFVAMVSGIVGARLFHILENLDTFVAAPMSMILTTSGLSIFGGLVLGTLAGVLVVRRAGLPLRAFLDAAAPAMMLGYAIGRIGCQVAGDGDWGVAADIAVKPGWLPLWLWAQTYDHNIVGTLIAAPGVYPTPMYETVMSLLCFGVLWACRKHPFQPGWLFAVYMALAGVERLLIEQIRINPVLNVFGIHATQAEMIATLLIIFGLAGTFVLVHRPSRGTAC